MYTPEQMHYGPPEVQEAHDESPLQVSWDKGISNKNKI